jgi:uracil-DNA glycosylase
LNKIIEQTIVMLERSYLYCITNTVACLPTTNHEPRAPAEEEIKACYPRVEELIKVVDPAVIIFVGQVAASYDLEKFYPRITDTILHPAFIHRQPRHERFTSFRKTVTIIVNAVDRATLLSPGPNP